MTSCGLLLSREQDMLKERLVLCDDFPWQLSNDKDNDASSPENSTQMADHDKLRYVGGVDLSFAKEDSIACGALVVMDIETMQVVYEDFDIVQLTMPYVAGFLAFREVFGPSSSQTFRGKSIM